MKPLKESSHSFLKGNGKSWQLSLVSICAKSLHLCLTLCDYMDGSLPGFLSMGFSRQENWSRLPCSTRGDLPDPEIKHASLISPAMADRFFTIYIPGKPGG